MDLTIDNPKLADLAPRWADFRGWTVLHTPSSSGIAPGPAFSLEGHSADDRRFLNALEAAAHRVAGADPAALGIALTPPEQYHVTVCDGINSYHLRRAGRMFLRVIETCIDEALGDEPDPEIFTAAHSDALHRLLEVGSASITYRFTGIEVRGRAVVAALEPEHDDLAAFEAIVRARHALQVEVDDHLDIRFVSPWRPHVTLAYLANRDLAQVAEERISACADACRADLDGLRLHYAAAHVYSFDDVVSYRRLDPRWDG